MSNGQTLERQLITEFMREVLTYLRHRPGVALESLTHSTPEMSFDLGKVRKNQVIHNRAGDRIFITNLTGVAYIRFNSATASKYKLRVPGISTPFQKLYLENEAQPGKSVSIIIGYGGFVDFAATDFATQATLALIKAKTDLLADIPKEAAATPTTYNVTMTNANTQYSQALPNGAYQLTFFVRGGEVAYRYAWVTGKVAAPTAPYTEVPADGIAFLDKLKLDSKTLYFACGSAGKIMQIEVLT